MRHPHGCDRLLRSMKCFNFLFFPSLSLRKHGHKILVFLTNDKNNKNFLENGKLHRAIK